MVLEDDLLFASRVELGLRGAGYLPRFVTHVEGLGRALKEAPVLILVNIGTRGIDWPRMIALAQSRPALPRPKVVGYGPHVDLALRQRALGTGCDAVVGRSAVANDLDRLAARYAWKPNPLACGRPLPDGILEGIGQFNRREFYACHDTIELVWVDEPGDVRLMYQGLLQIAVAFYHVQKGNWRGMRKMMARGKAKLLPFLPQCQGVDLARLISDIARCEGTLRELGAERLSAFDEELAPVIGMAR